MLQSKRGEFGRELCFAAYRIHIHFRGVQILAIFANEPQTVKIKTCENLSRHCFAPWTDSHLLDHESHQEHRHTHTDVGSYTECVLNRKIADLTFQNRKNKNPRKCFHECISSNSRKFMLVKISTYTVP